MRLTLLALPLGRLLVAPPALAQAPALPVPGVEAARDVPGAKELPNPGVDLRVCGQATRGLEIDAKDILPEVPRNLWALTTTIALHQQGYILVAP